MKTTLTPRPFLSALVVQALACGLAVAAAFAGEPTKSEWAPGGNQRAARQRLEALLKANRGWLLPSLEARPELAYEYRQEGPYLERVLIDARGNVMARLEASKESPERPTRQKLWLADGRSYSGDAGDRFVELKGGWNTAESPKGWVRHDRIVQHLATGVALDCALTRVAREPESFQAELRPVPNAADRYLLVLRPRNDARLFAGTMLTFNSWCYLHDVRYDRSEILCSALTHRPLEEQDYLGESELKGEFLFKNWCDTGGAAPGRIRAVMPYNKDGKAHALEMEARFHFAKRGVWLLDQVESRFRGGEGGSTGTVTVVWATAGSFQPLSDLLQKAEMTAGVLDSIRQAPMGSTAQPMEPGEWLALPLQAAWTDQARESAQAKDEVGRKPARQEPGLIGLHRARIVPGAEGRMQVELDGLSTASGKEFQTEWKVNLQDDAGRLLATGTTNLDLRAESAPTPFQIRLDLAHLNTVSRVRPERIAVEATVQRLTGAYHGHGLWYRAVRNE